MSDLTSDWMDGSDREWYIVTPPSQQNQWEQIQPPTITEARDRHECAIPIESQPDAELLARIAKLEKRVRRLKKRLDVMEKADV